MTGTISLIFSYFASKTGCKSKICCNLFSAPKIKLETKSKIYSNIYPRRCNYYTVFFIVVPWCMLFPSFLYCSNSRTSLHLKILKSHTKALKIRSCMFRPPLKPSSGGPWLYFARLLNWNVDLHLL